MQLKTYLRLWLILSLPICYEYLAQIYNPEVSLSKHFQFKADLKEGHYWSLTIGWIGLFLMIIMNVYTIRKKSEFLGKGNLESWLNFHIFCGLLGPTFIVFHCNFHIRGIVGISFWSMIVAALSGVVGRFLYSQLVARQKDLRASSLTWSEQLAEMAQKSTPPIAEETLYKIKCKALLFVGVPASLMPPYIPPKIEKAAGEKIASEKVVAEKPAREKPATEKMASEKPAEKKQRQPTHSSIGFAAAIFYKIKGDVKLFFNNPKTISGLPLKSRELLANYAIEQRRIIFIEPYRILMGYWQTFHFPFAVLMYITAFVHVGAEIILGAAGIHLF